MKRDPLESLRLVDEPVAPHAAFADELEGRIRRALAVGPVSIGLLEPDEDAIRRAYERAVAAGADVVRELQRETNPAVPDGYLGFILRDPEGNLWSMESVHWQID